MRCALLLVLCALVLAPSGGAAQEPPGFALIQTGPRGGTIWQGPIPNHQTEDTRLAYIYLPPDYSPTIRYPVVVFLHGIWGSPSSFIYALRMVELADAEIGGGRARPFIGVMPPGGPMTRTTDDEWAGVWEDYIVRDVVPWIDGHFRTDPAHRAIGGLSAGGFGAVDIGLRHPGMFHTLEAWGGYFRPFPVGPFLFATPAELEAHTPTLLVERKQRELLRLGIRFFLSTGTLGHGGVKPSWTFDFAEELTHLRLRHKLWVLPPVPKRGLYRAQLPAAIDYAVPPG
jgi:pimeloyl-ACP methyl ester carboxylesterase